MISSDMHKSGDMNTNLTLFCFAAVGFFLAAACNCKAQQSHTDEKTKVERRALAFFFTGASGLSHRTRKIEGRTPTFFFFSDARRDRAHLTAFPTYNLHEYAANVEKPNTRERLWVEHTRRPTSGLVSVKVTPPQLLRSLNQGRLSQESHRKPHNIAESRKK